MALELTATGRYYRVYVNGQSVSQHTTEREAIQKCSEVFEEAQNRDEPKPAVVYRHEYEVRADMSYLQVSSCGTTPSQGSGLTAENVTGDFEADGTIVISNLDGESFGATGPTLHLWDDWRNGSAGSQHSATPAYSATGKTWSPGSQLVADSSFYGGLGLDLINSAGNASSGRFRWATYPSADDRFFVSFTLRYPVGLADGNTKVFWIGGEDDSGENWYQTNNQPDLVVVQRNNGPGSGSDKIVSNDTAAGRSQWDQTGWTSGLSTVSRVSLYLYGTQSSTTTTGRWLQFVDGSVPTVKSYANYKALFVAADDPQGFNLFDFPGFFGVGVEPGDKLRAGEIYFASGAGAPARVEITDNATYLSSTEVHMVLPTAWANGEITGTVTSLPAGSKYLHIHDSTDTHTNGGAGRLIN